MPSLILCGKPCVGKTMFCQVLRERADAMIRLKQGEIDVESTRIVCEEEACPSKSKMERYIDSHAEKVTRAALKSEFDRCGNRRSTLILLDSSNYIKGYRYELYCISKASSDKHGVVWIKNSEYQSRNWNKLRREEGSENSEAFSDDMFDALNYRFETPIESNRWDKPLFVVDMEQVDINLQEKADEILESFLCHTQSLTMGVSTSKPISTESNVLHDVDKITQRICTLISEAQTTSLGSGRLSISIGDIKIEMTINRTVHLPELRRHRRQYVKWITGHPPSDCSELGVAKSFCKHLEQNL